ncbi:hypothetical protein Tco_0004557 [Tanacetum coccineum]
MSLKNISKPLLENDTTSWVFDYSSAKHKIQLLSEMDGIVKLLDIGIIYPIADSPWVSPIHCVQKKGGITVVINENDELFQQELLRVGEYASIIVNSMEVTAKKIIYHLTLYGSNARNEFAGNKYFSDHLSRIETSDDSEVDDNFPEETLMEINTKNEPWLQELRKLTSVRNPISSKYVPTDRPCYLVKKTMMDALLALGCLQFTYRYYTYKLISMEYLPLTFENEHRAFQALKNCPTPDLIAAVRKNVLVATELNET